ncbi:hypothetical protein PUN4_550257 [Paraburkholderia unamae]|nr:hypothetical protein PUN4_550257 [Paraburkholderia unamae]
MGFIPPCGLFTRLAGEPRWNFKRWHHGRAEAMTGAGLPADQPGNGHSEGPVQAHAAAMSL